MPERLHPTDAQTYWMSAKIPNDQFLLYCFDTCEPVAETLLSSARIIPELGVRIAESSLRYPRTVPMNIGTEHVVSHAARQTWTACLTEVAALFADQLTPDESPWRLHLFGEVQDAPRCSRPGLVVVLQISHALADGRVASSIARRLFGDRRERPIDIVHPGHASPREVLRRFRRARDLERVLDADVLAGRVPAQASGRARTRVNVAPHGPMSIRTVVRDRSELPGVSVTVGAATAVSLAFSRYLELHGDMVPADLGAEITLGRTGERRSRNHFRNAGIGLFPGDQDLVSRASKIESALADRRQRGGHPALTAQSLAGELVPAILLRWGVKQFDATVVPDTVTGNTVISSVARGDGDLQLGGGPVRFTAGFPGLSPVMGLTHGVHGIGDSVTLSITSSHAAVPDPDVYEGLLREAFDEVSTALRRSAGSG